MCGFAGVVYVDADRPVNPSILTEMGSAIAHRGPDGSGLWHESGVGLVHRRLSIIDLEGGAQPMSNEDHSVFVVFNGEIYNYPALRRHLIEKGHTLRSQSDTEVLVHLYEDEGESFVRRLRGMFAFALWDRTKKRLLLARDRVGIKPLYLLRDGEKCVFASELKAILAHPNVPRQMDLGALEAYLAYGVVPGPSSIFKGIEKLPPATVLSISPGGFGEKPSRYWQLSFQPDHHLGVGEWQEAVREKVKETVQAHMISDVPVGAFLSGGVDSSIVVATASQMVQGPLQTFSIGFDDDKLSELPYARLIAKQFGTEHKEEIVHPNAATLLDELTYYYDEPFADSSSIPTYLVSRLASRHVKVALSGDGGDEAFGGYARYSHDIREASLRGWLPRWFRLGMLRHLAAAWPKADWLPHPLRLKSALTNLSLDGPAAYDNTLQITRDPIRSALLRPEWARLAHSSIVQQSIAEAFQRAPLNDTLSGMIGSDVSFLLPDDFLVKVDRASMATGLEVRPPLLDHELLEMAARIPSKFKVHSGETKWILKSSFAASLSSETLYRKKKGFELPVNEWLRSDLRDMLESHVLNSNSPVAEFMDTQKIQKLYREHLSGFSKHGPTLWSILVFSCWINRFMPKH